MAESGPSSNEAVGAKGGVGGPMGSLPRRLPWDEERNSDVGGRSHVRPREAAEVAIPARSLGELAGWTPTVAGASARSEALPKQTALGLVAKHGIPDQDQLGLPDAPGGVPVGGLQALPDNGYWGTAPGGGVDVRSGQRGPGDGGREPPWCSASIGSQGVRAGLPSQMDRRSDVDSGGAAGSSVAPWLRRGPPPVSADGLWGQNGNAGNPDAARSEPVPRTTASAAGGLGLPPYRAAAARATPVHATVTSVAGATRPPKRLPSGSSEEGHGSGGGGSRIQSASIVLSGEPAPVAGGAHSPPRGASAIQHAPDESMGSSGITAVDYADIEQKQRELRTAVEYRMALLERTVLERDDEVAALRAKLRKIEEDYLYNYSLVEERDQALDEAAGQIQRMFSDLKRVKEDFDAAQARITTMEGDKQAMAERLREREAAFDRELRQMRHEQDEKKLELLEDLRRKEEKLEADRESLAVQYRQQMEAEEMFRAEVTRRVTALTEEKEASWDRRLAGVNDELRAVRDHAAALSKELEAATREAQACRDAAQERARQGEALARERDEAREALASMQRALEARLAEATSQSSQVATVVDANARRWCTRASELEVECGRLQGRVAALEEQLQQVTLQLDEERRGFVLENKQATEHFTAAVLQAQAAQRQSEEKARQSAAEAKEAEEAHAKTRAEAERQHVDLVAAQQRAEALDRERQRLAHEVRLGRDEVGRLRDEHRTAETHAYETLRLVEERERRALKEKESAVDEMERSKRRLAEVQERLQTDNARLTRELHRAQTAQAAMESQLQRWKEGDDMGHVVSQLTQEKEALEAQVASLEKTNVAIREQLSSFTLELQNDPVIRDAKHTAHRVQELQADLLRAQDRIQALQSALREAEAEGARHQMEAMRMGCEGSRDRHAGDPSMTEHQRLEREVRDTRAALQDALRLHQTCLARGDQTTPAAERRRGGRRGNGSSDARDGDRATVSTSRSSTCRESRSSGSRSCSASDRPSTGSSEAGAASRDRCRHRRRRGQRHERGEGRTVTHRVAKVGALREAIRDAETWRRKAVQLEFQLSSAARDVEQLRKASAAQYEQLSALGREKKALLELNGLLKTQLQDAYGVLMEQQAQQQQQSLAHHAVQQQLAEVERRCRDLGRQQPTSSSPSPDGAAAPPPRGPPAAAATANDAGLSPPMERVHALEAELEEIRHHLLHQQRQARRSPLSPNRKPLVGRSYSTSHARPKGTGRGSGTASSRSGSAHVHAATTGVRRPSLPPPPPYPPTAQAAGSSGRVVRRAGGGVVGAVRHYGDP